MLRNEKRSIVSPSVQRPENRPSSSRPLAVKGNLRQLLKQVWQLSCPSQGERLSIDLPGSAVIATGFLIELQRLRLLPALRYITRGLPMIGIKSWNRNVALLG
jgi:hypothetical protein